MTVSALFREQRQEDGAVIFVNTDNLYFVSSIIVHNASVVAIFLPLRFILSLFVRILFVSDFLLDLFWIEWWPHAGAKLWTLCFTRLRCFIFDAVFSVCVPVWMWKPILLYTYEKYHCLLATFRHKCIMRYDDISSYVRRDTVRQIKLLL